MPTVRELITKIGFDVENSDLAKFDKELQSVQTRIRKSTQGLDNLANGLAGAGTKLTAFVSVPLALASGFALKATSDVEQLNVAFTTFLGSEEKALALTKDLIDFAARTPFTIPGTQQIAKQLLAMGIEADDLIPTLKALGDVTAGVGGNLSRVAQNYGQVRTQGKLTGRDLRDFAVNGIPLIAVLAKQFNVAESAVADMVSAGKVGFKDVEAAFKSMSGEGGRFANLMDKQAKTLGGLFSNFIDNLFKAGSAVGAVAVETLHLKEAFAAVNQFLGDAVDWFERLPKPMKIVFLAIVGVTAALGPLLLLASVAIKTFLLFSVAANVLNLSLLPLILKLALITAILAGVGALIIGILDDINAWREGNRSAIGLILGDFETLVDAIKEQWTNLTEFIEDVLAGRWEKALDSFKNFLLDIRDTIREVISDWRELFGLARLETPTRGSISQQFAQASAAAPKGFFSQAAADFKTLGSLITGNSSLQGGLVVQNKIENTFVGNVDDATVKQVERAAAGGAESGTRDAFNSIGSDSLITEDVGR